MTRAQHLFLARVVVDGSRRRETHSAEFVDIIEELIAAARRDRALDAAGLLESEGIRRKEMHRNVRPVEPHGVKRYLKAK